MESWENPKLASPLDVFDDLDADVSSRRPLGQCDAAGVSFMSVLGQVDWFTGRWASRGWLLGKSFAYHTGETFIRFFLIDNCPVFSFSWSRAGNRNGSKQLKAPISHPLVLLMLLFGTHCFKTFKTFQDS